VLRHHFPHVLGVAGGPGVPKAVMFDPVSFVPVVVSCVHRNFLHHLVVLVNVFDRCRCHRILGACRAKAVL
jgi:hypothetical protein